MDFGSLSNDIVLLRPLKEEDFDTLFTIASDPEIWRQHPDHLRYTEEGFKTYFHYIMKTDHPYMIIDRKNNTPIGATSFYQKDNANKSIAIGYTFLIQACWGGRYNLSIKKLMINYAFIFYEKIIFHVREKNFRSQAALAKLGAIKEKEYPAPFDANSLQFEYSIAKTATL